MYSHELLSWAGIKHNYYCDRADFFMTSIGKKFKRPSFEFFARKTKTAGRATSKPNSGIRVCKYNVVYLLSARCDYAQTIAHEVAHHVIFQIDRYAAGHGDLFNFVLRDVMMREAKRYHNYNYTAAHVSIAKGIMELRKLKSEISDLTVLEMK
jgi:predicted SprT family Zn-dependent metalloprotease